MLIHFIGAPSHGAAFDQERLQYVIVINSTPDSNICSALQGMPKRNPHGAIARYVMAALETLKQLLRHSGIMHQLIGGRYN